jgi:hypothetical protein
MKMLEAMEEVVEALKEMQLLEDNVELMGEEKVNKFVPTMSRLEGVNYENSYETEEAMNLVANRVI